MFLQILEFVFTLLVLLLGPFIRILGDIFLVLRVFYQYIVRIYAPLTAERQQEDTALPYRDLQLTTFHSLEA